MNKSLTLHRGVQSAPMRKYALACVFLSITACGTSYSFAADGPPSADTAKQALEKRLLALKPTGTTERNVLFEDVRPGSPSNGGYPFSITATIRDYGPGYPPNKFYGETCVGRMEKWPFVLRRDAFGEWQIEGRMTVTDAGQCKRNPAEGVSSIPLASLSGTPAPTGAKGKQGATPSTRDGRGALIRGAYECWHFSSSRMGLNFTLQDAGRYLDSDRKSGTYTYDPASGKISFKGGALDSQAVIYETPGGRPKVSFRNSQGREIAFCEIASR